MDGLLPKTKGTEDFTFVSNDVLICEEEDSTQCVPDIDLAHGIPYSSCSLQDEEPLHVYDQAEISAPFTIDLCSTMEFQMFDFQSAPFQDPNLIAGSSSNLDHSAVSSASVPEVHSSRLLSLADHCYNAEKLHRKKKDNRLIESKADKIKRLRCVKPPCPDTCRLKCRNKVNSDSRENINKQYWSLSGEMDRRTFMFNACERSDVQRRTTKNPLESAVLKRSKTVKYFLKDHSDQRVQVCKRFFLTTLGYNRTNDTALFSTLTVPTGNLAPKPSRRGKHAAPNKGPHDEIISHIESFNPTIAHYRREHAPLTKYLPSDINITLMHSLFIQKNPHFKYSVSYEQYRKVVRDQKISFATLGHEECETCESFDLHGHKKDNLIDTCDTCRNWQSHHDLYTKSRALYKKFAETVYVNSDTIVYSADLEKVIMLPRLEMFKKIIFAPRLTTYNLTFAPVGTKKVGEPFAVLWHSAYRGRNQEEIVSGFNAFLIKHRDAKKIIIWLDNCFAQNKNWCLYCFLVRSVNSSEFSVEEIQLIYFEPGHTFMSADSFHHQVEQALKKQQKTYDFQDFVEAVKSANSGKVDVKEMEMCDFFDWKNHKSEQKMKNMDERVYLKDIVHLKTMRGNFNLFYKTSYDESEDFAQLDFLQARVIKKFPVVNAFTVPNGFPADKKTELLKALDGIIPENRNQFWQNLPTPVPKPKTTDNKKNSTKKKAVSSQ